MKEKKTGKREEIIKRCLEKFKSCEVLDVTPYDLLSGAEHKDGRSGESNTYIIDKETDIGILVESYQELDYDRKRRLMGYMDALIKG